MAERSSACRGRLATGYDRAVPAAPEPTEEILPAAGSRPPPLPADVVRPGPSRSGLTAVGARQPAAYRRPWRRLLRAYRTTFQIVLSYLWMGLRARLRINERAAALTEETHRRNARRALKAVVELQGLFIKVGQLISIMANFLPQAFRRELEGVQDQVPPRPFADIEARFREEFAGRGPDEVFAQFDAAPIASASIGQVHIARMFSGEQVAVKVQYPDIEAIVRTDLRALRFIFGLLARFMPDWGFHTIYQEIREMVLAELDYRKEAEAMRRIAENFRQRPDVRLPRVMKEFSTGRVLTTEWMVGIKAADVERLTSSNIDRRRAAHLAVEAYCQQIFIDGIYHADPHPGNLLFAPGGTPGGGPTLVFLDFGATAEVSQGMRKGLITFLQGAMTKDSTRIVTGMKEMGFISRQADPEVFDRVVQYFHDRFRAQLRVDGFSLKDIKFEAEAKLASLLDLRELNVSLADLRDAFHVPKEWVLLERTLLLLLGLCTTLDPEMNPIAAIEPYVERFLLGEKKEWSEAVMEAAREAVLSTIALPSEVGRFLQLANRGDLGVKVGNLDRGVHVLYTGAQQLLWGGLAVAATTFAVIFDGRGQDTARTSASVAAGAFGLLLLSALLRGRRLVKERRRRSFR